MVKLIIDNRENIKDSVKEKLPDCEFSNLALGDYIFKIDDKDVLVIERKTINDYAASIVDGRNREQKKRLITNYNPKQILYLIEGSITDKNSSIKYNKVTPDTIMSSIINTILRDNIQVFHTSSTDETIYLLTQLYNKFKKNGTSFMEKDESYDNLLINTVKQKKNQNITPNIVAKMMFNCIPGISNKVSTRLVDKFTDIPTLTTRLREFEDKKEMIDFIVNTKMDDSEKARKISKSVSENIITYLSLG